MMLFASSSDVHALGLQTGFSRGPFLAHILPSEKIPIDAVEIELFFLRPFSTGFFQMRCVFLGEWMALFFGC